MGIAREPAADWLTQVLSTGRTVHQWAAGQEGVETMAGRGTVHSVPAPTAGPDARHRWAVRHYRRGGAVARLLDDRYLRLGPTRPELELEVSEQARQRGIPTPAIMAAAWYPAGAFYRADLVTELVPDATTLADSLFTRPAEARARSPDDTERALGIAGRLTRRLGELGLHHADLNAMNILITVPGEEAEAWVVDLDRAHINESGDRALAAKMLVRLSRSLMKLARAAGRTMSGDEWLALRSGFEASSA